MGWKEVRFLMFTAAFDASGREEGLPFLVVAGFISSAKGWTEFSRLWDKRLGKDGLKYFRASEFALSVGGFKGWKGQEARRRSLLGDLMALVKDHAFRKFGAVIASKEMQAVPGELKEKFFINSYSVAGRSSAIQVSNWRKEQLATNVPFQLVFEDGDLGKGELIKRIVADGFPEPAFRPKNDEYNNDGSIKRHKFVPLQAADWLAYEYFLAHKHVLYERKENYALRWAIDQFESVVGPIKICTTEGFQNMETDLRVAQETEYLELLKPKKS